MKVAEVMRSDLTTVSVDTTLADAVVTLADAHVSGLPVVDERGKLVGVLSTTDVLTAIAEATIHEDRERIFQQTAVGDIMTPRPETVEPDADVLDVARRMLYREVRRLFVELDGKLLGVISQTDIVGALAVGKV
jgi:CBS domain-containing protein